jgi:modulator of FtsH protease
MAWADSILYIETNTLFNGAETNYIMTTVTLYVAIFNLLFTSLLHLLGTMNADD